MSNKKNHKLPWQKKRILMVATIAIVAVPSLYIASRLWSSAATKPTYGLNATYFSSPNFRNFTCQESSAPLASPNSTALNTPLSWSWQASAPCYNRVSLQQFSVRLSGYIKSPIAQSYTFCLNTNYPAKLKVAGKTLVETKSPASTPLCSSNKINLKSGKKVPITIEMQTFGASNSGPPVLSLSYQKPAANVVNASFPSPTSSGNNVPTIYPVPKGWTTSN